MRTEHNTNATVFASAAYAEGANNSAKQENLYAKGAVLTLDYTAESGTSPTLDVKLQRYDALSDTWTDIPGAAFAQIAAIGVLELVVYPGATVAANLSVSTVLPRNWRAVGTVGGTATPTVTFTLGVAYVL